jgi:acetoin utilization protein AcuC
VNPTALYFHDDLHRYDMGMGHPFRGERFSAFMQAVKEQGFEDLPGFEVRGAPRATDEDLHTVHDPTYLERLGRLAETGGMVSMDTPVNPGMLEAGRRIFGSALAAVDAVVEDPGTTCVTLGGLHHAGVAYGEGFCVYNDVAGAVRRLLDLHGMERVMVLDTDAHQGNGTMDIFYEEPKLMFLSIHQHPLTLYPGKGYVHEIGSGKGLGYTVNVPMPPGSTRAQYERVWSEVVEPITSRFRPQVIIQNGGVDPLWDDQLTDLGLELPDVEWLGGSYVALARSVGAPLVSMFLSGYSDRVVPGWLTILKGLVDPDPPVGEVPSAHRPGLGVGPSPRIEDQLDRTLAELKGHLSDHWHL